MADKFSAVVSFANLFSFPIVLSLFPNEVSLRFDIYDTDDVPN
jgi:hypothetical protein